MVAEGILWNNGEIKHFNAMLTNILRYLIYWSRINVLLRDEEEVQADPGPRKWQISSFFIFCFILLRRLSAPGERTTPSGHMKVRKFIHSEMYITIYDNKVTDCLID